MGLWTSTTICSSVVPRAGQWEQLFECDLHSFERVNQWVCNGVRTRIIYGICLIKTPVWEATNKSLLTACNHCSFWGARRIAHSANSGENRSLGERCSCSSPCRLVAADSSSVAIGMELLVESLSLKCRKSSYEAELLLTIVTVTLPWIQELLILESTRIGDQH